MASFWGSGVPKIYLIDQWAGVNREIVLPTPDKGGREFYYTIEADPKTNPLTGEMLPRVFGYRAYLRLYYSGAVSEAVEDLVDVVNSTLQIKVVPYSNVTALNFFATVQDFRTGHKDGYVAYDTVEIVLVGKELKPAIPNFDTYYVVSRNKSIYTAP